MASTNLPPHAAACLDKFLINDNFKPDYKSVKFSYKGHGKDENSDLNILGITSDPNATAYYRIQNPLRYLAQTGAKVRVEYVPELQHMNMSLLEGRNFVIMSRAYDKALFDAILEVCNRKNITLIYDLDDCIDSIPRHNPSYDFYNPATSEGLQKLNAVHHAIENAHGVIFSTRELKDFYYDLAPYAHVSPNALDISLGYRNWEPYPSEMWKMIASGQGCDVTDESLLFGWSGGISHIEDLEWMDLIVPAILNIVPNAIFGMYCSSVLAAQFCIEKWQLPANRVMYIPVKSFHVYPGYLSLFDVAMVPLANNEFNRCKSDLKLMEWNAVGTPYVATDAPSYVRYHLNTNQIGGAIVENHVQMANEVVSLLQNPRQLKLMSLNLINSAKESCDVSARLAQYGYTLRVIRDNSKSVLKMPSVVSILDSANAV